MNKNIQNMSVWVIGITKNHINNFPCEVDADKGQRSSTEV